MPNYRIFAGLGGGFGGATYEETSEFRNEDEAMNYAYSKAVEEYESYAGMHGLLDYDGCREDLEESGFLEDTISENEIEDMIENHYISHMESWLDYYVEEVKEPYVEEVKSRYCDLGYDIDHDDCDDDDADCYCE